MKKNYLFFVLLLALQGVKTHAQNITVNSGDMPNEVVACGDAATFKVNVFGPLNAGSIINVQLPTGVKFKSLVSGNVTATSTAQGVEFRLNSTISNASTAEVITYTVDTPCSTITGNTVKYTVGSTTTSTSFPQVKYSLLEVTEVSPASSTINVFSSQDLTFKIRQSAATYSNNIKVLIKHSTKISLTTSVGTLTLGTPSGGSQTDIIEYSAADIATIGNGNNRFEQNEVFQATVKAKLLGCTTGETIGFQAAYGCNPTTSCTTGNITNVGLTSTPVSDPNLTMTQTKKPWPGLLPSDAGFAEYVLKNNGNGPAYNVKIQLGFNQNGIAPQKRTFLDFTDFKVGNTLMSDIDDVAQFNFTSDPDGPGGLEDLDGDGFFDDLAPNASVTITAKLIQTLATMNIACYSKYYNDAGTSGVDAVRWRLIYTNYCSVDKSYNENNDNLGSNSPFTMGIISQTSDIIATNGNVNFNTTNNSFSAEYNFGSNNTSISSGAGFMVNGSEAFWRVKMVLPAGISPSTTAATYSDNKFTITYNAALSNASTHTYYYDLKPSASNQGEKNLAISGKINVPLVVDPTCNSNGVFNIKFSSALYRDNNNVFIPELGCVTSPNFSLGCGVAPGLSIENFDLKRQSFGFLSTNPTQRAQESDITGTELNNYLNGDKAVAAYTLKLIDPTIKSAKITFEYNKFNWFKKGEANGGIKTITGSYKDPITNIVTPFTVTAAMIDSYAVYNDNYTGADGLQKSGYVFDVMKLFQAGGPLASITPVANAIIEYNVNLVVNEDLHKDNQNTATDTASGYMVTGISTYPSITLADNNSIIGNYKADKAIAFSYFVTNTITAPTNLDIVQCTDGTFEALFNFSRNSKFGDLFTKEIRYNARIGSLEMLIPKGITYTPNSATFKLYGESEIAINAPIITYGYDLNGAANPNGLYDKYVFVNNGTWPQTDATKNFDLVGVRFKYSTNNLYRDYISQSNNSFKSFFYATTGNFSLNFDIPRTITANTGNLTSSTSEKLLSYQVSSAAPNPTTAMNTASWPLTINNQSTSAIPNFWIAVESPNNNITPTLWDGTTEIPMVTYGTGKFWAKVGNVPAGAKTYTLKSNNFTICGSDNFIVKTSFECSGYPADPNSGFPNQGNRKLWTQDISMSLTTQNPALTINSSVNTSGTELFTMCGDVEETLTVTNGANGFAYDIVPQITLPTGMQFKTGSFKVNYNNVDYAIGDPTVVSGTTYSVDIYSNPRLPFLTTGLPGTSDLINPHTFILKYDVNPLCYTNGTGTYISGSRINYQVKGKSGCQQDLALVNGQTVITSQPINIGGNTGSKVYQNSITTLETNNAVGNHQINDVEELQVKVINQGDTTGNLETIKVFVDPKYDYVANSYNIQTGNTYSSLPVVNEPTSTLSANGKRKLEWNLPNGFTTGQTILFNFKVKVIDAANTNCTATSDATMNTYVGASALCTINGQTCDLEYPTGIEKAVTLNSFTPSISGVINNSRFTNSGSITNYTITYAITNMNAIYEVKSNLKVRLYSDTNNNGIVDAGEPLLDTQFTPTPVAGSASQSQSISGSFASISNSNLLFTIDSNENVSNICSPVVLSVKSYCYKPATTSGTTLETKYGITSLNRAGEQGDNWPMVRKGAWMALESHTKGFVLNRLSESQISAIPTNQLVEGMMVYDTTNKCLKMYTTINGGTSFEWKCLTTQTCPE